MASAKKNLVCIKSANFELDISTLPLKVQKSTKVKRQMEGISEHLHRALVLFSGDPKMLLIAQNDLELDISELSFEQRYLHILYSFIKIGYLEQAEEKSQHFNEHIFLRSIDKHFPVQYVPDEILNDPIKLNMLCNMQSEHDLYFNYVAFMEPEWERFGCLEKRKFEDFKDFNDRYIFVAISLILNFDEAELAEFIANSEHKESVFIKNLEMFIPLNFLPSYISENPSKLEVLSNLSLDEIFYCRDLAQSPQSWHPALFDGHFFNEFNYLAQRIVFVAGVLIEKNLMHLASKGLPINFFNFEQVQ